LVTIEPLENQISNNSSESTSALSFGSSSGSNFIIEPGVGTNILVNITNHALIPDTANVSIISSSGWNVVWPRNSVPSIGEDIPISSNELVWIQFRVDVPFVENGAPLAGSKHFISVKAISQNDGLESFWNFTIEVTAVSGITIDSFQNFASIEPGEKMLLPVTLRNIGNHNANLVIKVQPMLDSGLPVEGTIPDQSLTYEGWSVGTFDLYKIENLPANGSGVVLIEYAAPYDESGEINIRISAFNEFEPLEIITVNQSAIINRIRGVDINFDEENICESIRPSNSIDSHSCIENLSVTNTGNYNDEIELQVLSNPIWSNVKLSTSTISLAKGQNVNNIDVEIEIINGTMARTNGEITIGAFIEGNLIEIEKYPLAVDSIISWELQRKETMLEENNCTISLTFENTGNDLDGIMVSIDMNVSSNFGLIPPPNSIYDSTGNIRFFELRDVEPNQNISFSAFATTPMGLEMNGSARLEVITHSILDPSINFSVSEDIEYLGEYYRLEEEIEPSIFSELLSDGISFLSATNGLILTIFVVSVGSLMLYRALIKREEDIKKYQTKTVVKPEERVEDWTKKFESGPEKQPINIKTENVNAATDLLDYHTKEENLKDADLMALGLIEENTKETLGEKLMPSNQSTKKTKVSSADIDPSQSIGKSTKTEKTTDTDFDLDL
tara:strand:+ start:777 stop:2795 length:2019 start_codon:yes stop_codon:yes gene_type:complete